MTLNVGPIVTVHDFVSSFADQDGFKDVPGACIIFCLENYRFIPVNDIIVKKYMVCLSITHPSAPAKEHFINARCIH